MRIVNIDDTNRVLADFDSSVSFFKGRMRGVEGSLFSRDRLARLTLDTPGSIVAEFSAKHFDSVEDLYALEKQIKEVRTALQMLEKVNT